MRLLTSRSQFHYGSIKTISVHTYTGQRSMSLNSTMVRLKPTPLHSTSLGLAPRLNSTMVRLKPQSVVVMFDNALGLNSTMVRLKLDSLPEDFQVTEL